MSRLLPGGEPFYFPGGPTGCLLVHGFTASPQEMRGLGEHLAGRGHTVLGIRLFAHAASLEDMLRARWGDWYASVEDGYAHLRGPCDRVVVMGMSLGGVLSLLLAAAYPVAGVVAMSTPFAPPTDLRIRLPLLLAPLVRFFPKGPPDWRDPQAQASRVAYPAYPLRTVGETFKAMAALRQALPTVTSPTLLIHSTEDVFVPPENSRRIAAGLTSAQVETLFIENSSHVITLDLAREHVFEAASGFVSRHAASTP
jgi:carboxylesterase